MTTESRNLQESSSLLGNHPRKVALCTSEKALKEMLLIPETHNYFCKNTLYSRTQRLANVDIIQLNLNITRNQHILAHDKFQKKIDNTISRL